jgi:peptidoglycan/LPS O-acetylase OafA/YrhL
LKLLNKEKTKYGIWFPMYFILMLSIYIGYLFLDSYRLNRSVHWLSKSNLTSADIESINLIGTWTSNFEFVFYALFIITMCISIIGNKKNTKNIKRFLLVSTALFIGIALISFVLFVVTQFPIGNLMQPIVIPTCLLGGLLIYLVWVSRKLRSVE